MDLVTFYDAALEVSGAAASRTLRCPAFVGKHDTNFHRVMRGRGSGSPVVYIDLARPDDEITDAMIDGLCVCNDLPIDGPDRAEIKEELWPSKSSANVERVAAEPPSSSRPS